MREIDLAEFNPLGKEESTKRNLANDPDIERLKAEIEHFKKETENKYFALHDKYFTTEISDESAKAVLAMFPIVDFGEGNKWLSAECHDIVDRFSCHNIVDTRVFIVIGNRIPQPGFCPGRVSTSAL